MRALTGGAMGAVGAKGADGAKGAIGAKGAMGAIAAALTVALMSLTGCSSSAPQERAVTETVTVKAGLDDAWAAWTTTAGIKSFFAPEANIDARVGGAFQIFMDPFAAPGLKGADDSVILAIQEKKMLSFTWNAPPSLPEARKQRTVVIVRFTSRGDVLTEITLHHIGWGEPAADNQWGQAYDYFAKAWPNVLKNMKKRFDNGPVDWTPWLDRLKRGPEPSNQKQTTG